MSMNDNILWEETLRGGQTWSQILKRGQAIRVTDLEGGANVACLFYNPACTAERYNMPDTLKAQHIARLTQGFVLYSDMGRVMCSIISDSAGWHDPLGGVLSQAQLETQYGVKSYQEYRNEWTQAPKESLILELAKYSMDARDLTPTLNLFSKVVVDQSGTMQYVTGHSKAGDHVEIRADMPVLLLMSANHHPLEAGTAYSPKPVHLSIREGAPASADDPCRLSRAENARGFQLTERYCA
jgi:urea carboxylase-associated protein 2